jgi:hypothetical protein
VVVVWWLWYRRECVNGGLRNGVQFATFEDSNPDGRTCD